MIWTNHRIMGLGEVSGGKRPASGANVSFQAMVELSHWGGNSSIDVYLFGLLAYYYVFEWIEVRNFPSAWAISFNDF